MTMRSLGMASERLAQTGISTFEEYPDRIVQRTPSEPNYWHGNQVIFLGPTDPLDAVAQFEADHPQAAHGAIVWDLSGPDPASIAPVLAPLGYEAEAFDVLTLTGPIRAAKPPEGIVIRPLLGNEDWAQALDLMLETATEEGYDPATHLPYLVNRNANRRRQIADGLGAWFGAFDGEVLVADMGMFHDEKVARYQSVETKSTHRRRGICSALLFHSYAFALGRAPQAMPVIVAEADSNAGRLYRSMGFALAEQIVGATKPSDGAKLPA
ncbi:GNAT family N-acetyltransferase [Flavimaricola marinus]|uniref:N-acetyltransferase domain-containing protein n=1 Tax=Flavimaricola marinus TaxID=1819565 RepID=A0A238LC08_9RHOB|nr:GNAT family N-acetyltransferase [Flavimaricola marinus]SMY07151.1 hypothetical protein LOM8899_01283 [Flavimaricola marinus]